MTALASIRGYPPSLWLILALGLGIRLLCAGLADETADIANYRRVAITLASGGRLYADTPGIYPYPPPWSVVELTALWLAPQSSLPFTYLVLLPQIAADVAIAFLLFSFAPKSAGRSLSLAAAYALSPLPILISAVHGQFDAIPVLAVLVAVCLFERTQPSLGAGAALSIGIAFKSFPVLLLPLFLSRLASWRKQVAFAAVALLPVAGLLLPYLLSEAAFVRRELFGYSGSADHGWAAVARIGLALLRGEPATTDQLRALHTVGRVLFLGGYAALHWFRFRPGRLPDERPLASDVAQIFVLFYVCYSGISSQYLVWALPFLLLLDLRAALVYTTLATFSLLAFYNGLTPDIVRHTPFYVPYPAQAVLVWLLATTAWWLWCANWLVRGRVTAARSSSRSIGLR